MVHFIEAYRYYLVGRRFTLRTDHSSLKWLWRQKEPKDQLARWIQRLSDYDFVVEHRPGAKHGNADALSRKCFRGGACYHPAGSQEEIPAGTRLTREDFAPDEDIMALEQDEERDDAELLRLITHDEWIEAQRADPELRFVHDRLARGVGAPDRDELSPCGRSAKFWCAR